MRPASSVYAAYLTPIFNFKTSHIFVIISFNDLHKKTIGIFEFETPLRVALSTFHVARLTLLSRLKLLMFF